MLTKANQLTKPRLSEVKDLVKVEKSFATSVQSITDSYITEKSGSYAITYDEIYRRHNRLP